MRRLVCCGLVVAGGWRGVVAQQMVPAVGELLAKIYDYTERYSATAFAFVR